MNFINYIFGSRKDDNLIEKKKIKIYDYKENKLEVFINKDKYVNNILEEYSNTFKDQWINFSNEKYGLFCLVFETYKKSFYKKILLKDHDNIFEIIRSNKFNNLRFKFYIEKIKKNLSKKDFYFNKENSNFNNKNHYEKVIRKAIVKLKNENKNKSKDTEITLTNEFFIFNLKKDHKKLKLSKIPLIFIKNIERIDEKSISIILDNINYYVIELSNLEEREIWFKSLIFSIDNCKELNFLNEIQRDIMNKKEEKMKNFKKIIEIPNFNKFDNKFFYEKEIKNFKVSLENIFEIWKNNYSNIFKIDNELFIDKLKELLLNIIKLDMDENGKIENFKNFITNFPEFKVEIVLKDNHDININYIINKLNTYLELKTKYNEIFLDNYFKNIEKHELNLYN